MSVNFNGRAVFLQPVTPTRIKTVEELLNPNFLPSSTNVAATENTINKISTFDVPFLKNQLFLLDNQPETPETHAQKFMLTTAISRAEKQNETKLPVKKNTSLDSLINQVNTLEKVERRMTGLPEDEDDSTLWERKAALRKEIEALYEEIKKQATTLSYWDLEDRIKQNEKLLFQLNAPMATSNYSSVKDYSQNLEIDRLTNETNMYKETLSTRISEHSEEKRRADLADVTLNSAMLGHYQNKLGHEYYKMMNVL